MKNIKMKPTVPLFNLFKKQSSKGLYYQGSCMLVAQEERRKENC